MRAGKANSSKGGIEAFTREGRREFDYSLHGGALLLGVNGIVVIAHGRSSPQAIESAINLAVEIAKKDFLAELLEISAELV